MDNLGLSTREALQILHDDCSRTLAEFEELGPSSSRRGGGIWVRDVFCSAKHSTTLCWRSVLTLFGAGVSLLVASIFDDKIRPNKTVGILEALSVLLLLVTNVLLVSWDACLWHKEMPQRVKHILAKLKEYKESCHWTKENYPHLHSPQSPCITLQWTYRDGHLINLPWALLAQGDLILLQPGQSIPGKCRPVSKVNGTVLQMGDIFTPVPEGSRAGFSVPQARTPLQCCRYVMEETPYLHNLKTALQQALQRPVSVFNKERHMLMLQFTEGGALFFTILYVIMVNIFRYFYLSQWIGAGTAFEMFMVQVATAAIPLLPLVFPIVWILLNAGGLAWVLALFHSAQQMQVGCHSNLLVRLH